MALRVALAPDLKSVDSSALREERGMTEPPDDPRAPDRVHWRPLEAGDLRGLYEWACRCVAMDGGQPFAADPAFVARCYLSAGQSRGAFAGPVLACASSARPAAPGAWLPPSEGASAATAAQDVVVI